MERSSPADAGVSSELLLAFLDAAKRTDRRLHGFMLARHGSVIAEGWWTPYRPDAPHQLHSLTKLLLTTAVGLAVDEGLFRVEDRVVDLFAEDVPENPSENLLAMRVFHLLTGSTGQRPEDMWSSDPEQRYAPDYDRRFLALPVPFEPGTRFAYNPRASTMLSAAVEKTSGESLADYLRPRLFAPLGIPDPTWTAAGTHLFPLGVRTEDLLAVGQLYLDSGVWHGKRVLSEEYIDAAIAPRVPTAEWAASGGQTADWQLGYGYQFWRHRHGTYGINGALGQYCVVFPDHDAVLAITSETVDMQATYDLIWEHVLPALEEPATPDADAELARSLASAALQLPAGSGDSPRATRIQGREFAVDDNDLGIRSIRFSFDDEGCTVALTHDSGVSEIAGGWLRWVDGVSDLPGTPIQMYDLRELHPARVSAAAAWCEDSVLELRWRYIETPHGHVLTCRFDEHEVTIAAEPSLPMPGSEFVLRGKSAN